MKHLLRTLGFVATVLLVAALTGLVAGLCRRAIVASPSQPPALTPPREAAAVAFAGLVDGEHGVAALAPLQPGRVAEVLVREDEEVEAGAPLVRLEDRQARLRLEEARAALSASREALTQAEMLPAQHRKKLEEQLALLAAARHERDAAQAELDSRARLREKDLLSAEELRAWQARVLRLGQVAAAEQARLEELRLHDPSAAVWHARCEATACAARCRQAEEAVAECTLKAPRAGRVLRVLVSPGEVLDGPGRTALLFCARGRRLVRAELNPEQVGQVLVGQSALVEDAAATGPSWRGRVVRVSGWCAPRRGPAGDSPDTVGTVECLIGLDEGAPLPRVGQRVHVTLAGARQHER